jgi:hypothetical protein
MIHEDQRILISQYVDAELVLSEEEGLFGHLAECGECREFLRHSLRLRADLMEDPFRMGESAGSDRTAPANGGSFYALDRRPVISNVRRSRLRSRISTFALIVMVTLFVGFLFSVKISMQKQSEPTPQELVQPR